MADDAEQTGGNEKKAGGWNPSRGFWIGMTAVAIFAGVLAAAGAYAASTEPGSVEIGQPDVPAPTVQVSHAPRKTTPPDDVVANPEPASVVALAPSDPAGAPDSAVSAADGAPAGTASSETAVDAFTSSTVVSPTPVASSMSQSPVFVPPAPAAALAPEAEAIVELANSELGIEIVTEGQNWGASEGEQVANLGAVVSAWQQLPLQVTSSIVEHPHRTLQVLSNQQGRTSGGWQPHGDRAATFYTNSDQGVEGYRLSNQIVLATGAGVETVLHELMHAYSLRNVAADDYATVFLEDEMRSFMAAAGWELLVTDDELLDSLHEPWSAIDGLFAHDGSGCIQAANPLEAFAAAGARYFAGADATECAEFAWFEATFG